MLPNVGSPGMIGELRDAGYAGPIALRVNPGFGHGHVQSCDTGGPSSKHGIWHEDLGRLRGRAADAKLPIVALHAHVGTGPQIARVRREHAQAGRLLRRRSCPSSPTSTGVNLGGGIPAPLPPGRAALRPRAASGPSCSTRPARLAEAAGRPIRVEIEPGRYPSRRHGAAGRRVKDIKADAHQRRRAPATASSWSTPASTTSSGRRCTARTTTSRSSAKGPSGAPEPFVVAGPAVRERRRLHPRRPASSSTRAPCRRPDAGRPAGAARRRAPTARR